MPNVFLESHNISTASLLSHHSSSIGQHDFRTTMTPTPTPSRVSTSHFPAHSEPRVWFITSAASPVGIATAREVLAQGDIVIAGDDTVIASEQDPSRIAELAALSEDAEARAWQDRLRVIKLVSRCEAPNSILIWI